MIKKLALIALLASMILSASPLAMAQAITAVANKTNYVPGDILSVAGTGPANDDVSVAITNPRGNLIGVAQGKVGADNRYNITVMTFPSTNSTTFPYGSYSVKVTAAAAATSTTVTVNFLATILTVAPPAAPGAGGLLLSVSSDGTYFPGDKVRIYVLATNNGALVDPTFTIAHIHTPANVLDQLLGTQVRIHAGYYYFEYTIPSTAPAGTHGPHVEATYQGNRFNHASTFQVRAANRDTAGLAASIASLTTAFNGLSTSIGGISTAITTLDGKVTAIPGAITAAVGGAQTGIANAINGHDSQTAQRITALQGAVGQSISGAQTAIIGRVDSVANNIQTALNTAIQGSQSAIIKAVNDGIGGLGKDIDGIEKDVKSAATGTAQSSTFVLVIAGLAALAVVLEIAILVRKRA